MSTHFGDVLILQQCAGQNVTSYESFELLRSNMKGKKLILFRHGENGYINYIATNKNTKPWSNPHRNGLVLLSASSLNCQGRGAYGDISNMLELNGEASIYTDVCYISINLTCVVMERFTRQSCMDGDRPTNKWCNMS
jgi:hypothetical protein